MNRIERKLTWRAEPLQDVSLLAINPKKWFESQPSVGKTCWFLAHAEDGVIWGIIRDGQLSLSSVILAVELDARTLQQAFLFGEQAEVRVWREGDGFKACRVEDRPTVEAMSFDEDMILWGTQVEAENDGFTRLSEGRQGLRHAVPLVINTKPAEKKMGNRPFRLQVRHYIEYEEGHGQCRICAGRLVGLKVSKEETND